MGLKGLFSPIENAPEAAMVEEIWVIPLKRFPSSWRTS
jgi:hypothetical protein